jgi:hypothetical protein
MSEDYERVDDLTTKGMRMRPPINSVYNRQVAKCLCDIAEIHELPALVEARIKKAIEWTCKDIDKLNKHNRNGENNDDEDTNYNR